MNLSPQKTGGGQAKQASARLEALEHKVESAPFDPKEHLDKKRALIAQIFVWGFLILILVVLVGVPLYNQWIGKPTALDMDKTLSQVGGLLGTPLGFVVGYYFKEYKKR